MHKEDYASRVCTVRVPACACRRARVHAWFTVTEVHPKTIHDSISSSFVFNVKKHVVTVTKIREFTLFLFLFFFFFVKKIINKAGSNCRLVIRQHRNTSLDKRPHLVGCSCTSSL